jgi:hypothetical protein
MASKVNILGKGENARESHIKGNGIYQGRKLQGMEERRIEGRKKRKGRKER